MSQQDRGPAIEAPVRIGEWLAGKYRVERVLGLGGMGVVVAAMHVQLDQRVAIKFLLPEAISTGDAVARFEQEARAAAQIRSEHVAKVLDVGVLETGSPYIVMEYLEGQDLAARVRAYGALPIATAVEFVLQACEAIAEAHSLGIVHRDLKPANLFAVARSDRSHSIKVLDFGISKLTKQPSELQMTRTTTVMGSPLYMSPEQMRSTRDVDLRTDIWAIGVILYELLTGQVPFLADTLPELCCRVIEDEPKPLRAVRPEVPEQLERVVLRCLEKVRDDRYPSIAELAFALAPFAPPVARISVDRIRGVLNLPELIDEHATTLHPPTTGIYAPPQQAISQQASQEWARTRDGKRGRHVQMAAVGAAVGGATIALVALLTGGNHLGQETELSEHPSTPFPVQGTAPRSPRPTPERSAHEAEFVPSALASTAVPTPPKTIVQASVSVSASAATAPASVRPPRVKPALTTTHLAPFDSSKPRPAIAPLDSAKPSPAAAAQDAKPNSVTAARDTAPVSSATAFPPPPPPPYPRGLLDDRR